MGLMLSKKQILRDSVAKTLAIKKKTTELCKMEEQPSDDYRYFMRMTHEAFQKLLNLVKPCVRKQDNVISEAVTAEGVSNCFD